MACSLGRDVASVAASLRDGQFDTLVPEPLACRDAQVLVGRVPGELPALPPELAAFECRNNRLLHLALGQILSAVRERIEAVGAARVAVVIGSSTSGIDATEAAFPAWRETGTVPAGYDYAHQHEMGAASDFVARASGATGPCWSVSTACSSGAKVMASARSLLALGLADAVIVGGADALCHVTLEGFDALQSLSKGRSRPLAEGRDGLNIGEGAALFLMVRGETGPVLLCGVGESSDAHHMNAPHPEGLGAEAALRAALADAGIAPEDVGYVNLHGTATPLNDAMEAKAMSRVFPAGVPCSSTKALTGHCLGAAGAIEAGLCWIGLSDASDKSLVPPHVWGAAPDPELPGLSVVSDATASVSRRYWASSSFAFGGNNCALVLGGVGC